MPVQELADALVYLPEEAHGLGWQDHGAAGYLYSSAAAAEAAAAAGALTVNGEHAALR